MCSGAVYVDEGLNEQLRGGHRGIPPEEPGGKVLTRTQKKSARKKQKKKEKKVSEVAFEIEEITTGFECLSTTVKESASTQNTTSSTAPENQEATVSSVDNS